MKYFVCATIRILGAWLSEETQALRDEVYDILPFILQLGSDTFEAQKLAKLAALPGRGSNDLSNFTPESALTILQKHGMYTRGIRTFDFSRKTTNAVLSYLQIVDLIKSFFKILQIRSSRDLHF